VHDAGESGVKRMPSEKHGVFISHINEEKPVAAVLQKYLKLAFGDGFRVFVSTDKSSIPGGQKWFNHIIENLRVSQVILVLVSQESKRREWTNFESGFGNGQESLVIPVAIKAFPLASYPFRRRDTKEGALTTSQQFWTT
jgi:hypothetical protein